MVVMNAVQVVLAASPGIIGQFIAAAMGAEFYMMVSQYHPGRTSRNYTSEPIPFDDFVAEEAAFLSLVDTFVLEVVVNEAEEKALQREASVFSV